MSNADFVKTGPEAGPQRLTSTDLVDISRLEPVRRQQVGIIAQSVTARDSTTIATSAPGRNANCQAS